MYIYIYIIEHNRHFLSTYFFVNPFELPYLSNDIRWEVVDKPFIIKNPTNHLKSEINKLITANNAELNSTKLPKIIRNYKPGSLYVKIHKPNHPLRLIISQIPTPIY